MTTTSEMAPDLAELFAALESVDSTTRTSVHLYLDAKRKASDKIVVLAAIPDGLAGQDIVLAARAPAEGSPMNFTVTPERTEGGRMVVDMRTSPNEPIAITHSTTDASTALYRVDERGDGSVAPAPTSELSVALDAILRAIETSAGPAAADGARRGAHVEDPDLDYEQLLRDRVAAFRKEVGDKGYSTKEAADVLGVTSLEAVRARVARKGLLGIKINSDFRYPRWQFDQTSGDGVIKGLSEVLSVANLSALELAAWFETPINALGGKTPERALRDGEITAVRAAAEAAGAM